MVRLFTLIPILTMLIAGELAIGGCTNQNVSPVQKVVFMGGYKAQANLPFVAVYVAKEKGYFLEQDLEVEIKHANRGEHLQLLMSGEIDFTTSAAASVLKYRSNPGLPITAFVLWGQRGQQAFISLDNSGINSIKDWEGKTFGYKISPPPDYLGLLKTNNIKRSSLKEVNAGFDPRILTEGKVDILAVFKSNEPDTIRRLGFGLNMWDPADYGIPTMGLTYVTRQDIVDNRAGLTSRFLKATLKAAHFINVNKEETLDIVMRYAPNSNREHQEFMLESEMRDATGPVTERYGMGWFTAEQWDALYKHLLEFEVISDFDFKSAFTRIFLEEIHQDNVLIWP